MTAAVSDPSSRPRRLSAAVRLVVRRYADQARARPWLSGAALVLPGIGNVLLFYAPPLVIARILGAFARNERLSATELTPYVLTIAACWLAGEAVWRVAGAIIGRAEIRAMESLYIQAMQELLAKDLAFFHDNYAGSLTKRALGFARRYEDVFDVMAFSVVANVLPLAFVGTVLWQYSPWLLVVLAGMMTLTCLVVLPRIRRRQQLVDARETASNVLAGHLADSIANAEAVRAYAREDDEARIHTANVTDYGTKTLRSWDYQNLKVDMITAPMYVLTNTLGLVMALTLGSGTGANLEMVFITFSYFATITRVMWEFNRIYRILEAAVTDAAQFAELLLDRPVVVDPPDVRPFDPKDFGIVLDGVRFRHGNGQAPLFDGFSLDIAPGTRVGLVGRSGGGKTTLTRLLLRFADVEGGEIRLGGQPIDRVPQHALRRAIAYVPQDPSMFHRSIADNIRVGRPEATDAEVRRAAELAHAADFIDALPAGYRTLVGERGVKLSGGQRQRIAIARAILKDAPVLVLDEATSALDSESEMLIQEALWTLLAGRTAVVVAHRLSTVRRMDRLVVLDQGQIIEQGTHEDLVARPGVYASLWAHQSGGFLAEV